jgi:hypothetical protein
MELNTNNTEMNSPCSVLEVFMVHRWIVADAWKTMGSNIKNKKFCWLQIQCVSYAGNS